MTGLTSLHLDHNQLSGTVPTTWGKIGSSAAPTLTVDLSDNALGPMWRLPNATGFPVWPANLSVAGTFAPQRYVGPCPCHTAANVAALMDLYEATNGTGWTNSTGWSRSPSTPLCEWYGSMSCNGTDLSAITLANNRLAGTLPATWANLTSLRRLDVARNNVGGTLPSEWANMTALYYLDLNSNNISGTLPPTWATLTAMQTLYLYRNEIKGSLPSQWSRMSALQYLRLDDNKIYGALPSEWATMTAVSELSLDGNSISGTLPPEWASMTLVSRLVLHSNQLTGTVPTAWGTIGSRSSAMPTMLTVDLGDNVLGPPWRLPSAAGFPVWPANMSVDGTFAPQRYVGPCSCHTVVNVAALMDLYAAANGTGWTNNTGWSRNPSTALCV